MRTAVVAMLMSAVAYQTACADKMPLSVDRLQQEADMIVVGSIDKLRVESEPSQVEPGQGNFDWAVYVTIRVDTVEKGTLTDERVEARCFRVKSRASYGSYVGLSGHHPIPDVGTHVRAFLQGSAAAWQVLLPNGLSSPEEDANLADASQVAGLVSGGFTYLLPIEAWLVLAVASVAIVFLGAIVRRRTLRNG